MTNAPFKSVLIANRGEIACRLIRTIQSMGMEAMIVYHSVDADTPAVKTADSAIEIHGQTPVAAYLDGDQIVEKAKAAGANAIHPGYGFLSENADFASAVVKAGMVFVGPTPEAITLMGDKVRARNFVAARGFPVAPSAIEDDDPETFVERARQLEAPLLIKPSAGGGGKGMRIVRDMDLLEEELERARSEGQRYFGDGRLYVERYIERPRHIEVQVLGDSAGDMVHLFERECSVQRRFQKVIEESPSPGLTEAERASICDVAVGIAKAANYRNAGTVEFIYGGGEFYFLEMNTRLQVEHPVTEEVTGIDLVAEQLKIAAGEPLGFTQDDIVMSGSSIELRLYAEDSARDFSPTTGPLLAFRVPENVRVDAGISEGGSVTANFDPMIAKVIVHADTRAQAIAKAQRALAELVVLGCKTNAAFLQRLISAPDFQSGVLHTGLIAEKPELAADPPLDPDTIDQLLAAAALSLPQVQQAADAVPQLHGSMGNWRN